MLFIPAAHPIPHQCVIQADGYWENPRFVTVVNGSLPGPTIEVYEGQNVIVHVKNSLKSQCTVIHWHGLHQKGKLSRTDDLAQNMCHIYMEMYVASCFFSKNLTL